MPRARLLVVATTLALIASACTGGDNSTAEDTTAPDPMDAPSSGTVTLAPETRPLEPEDARGLDILEDRILIPAGHELSNIAETDVLSLGITDQTPNGMLRYVTGVAEEGERVVAMTRQATLGEAFREADISATVPLTFDSIENVATETLDAAGSGGVLAGSGGDVRFVRVGTALQETFDADADVDVEPFEGGFVVAFDKVLSDADEDMSTTDDQVRVVGSVTAVLEVDIDIDVGLGLSELGLPTGELDSASVIVEGNVSANVKLEAEQAGSFGDSEDLFAVEFSPIAVPAGPIIVYLRPRMPVTLGWNGSVSVALETSVETSAGARLGVTYDGDKWDPVDDIIGPDFDFNPPIVSGGEPATMSVRLGPRLEVRLWETLASASVGIDAVLQLDTLGSSPWLCLSAGLEGPLGFKFLGERLFDHTVWESGMTPLAPNPCESTSEPRVGARPVAGFSRVFGSCTPLGDPLGESGRRIAALADGGMIVAAGVTRDAPTGSQAARFDDLWLLRLDAAGGIVWSRVYRDLFGEIVALEPVGSGFVVALETGRLLFFDGWGEITGSRRLQGLAFLLRGLARAPGGGFLAFGVEGQDPVLARLSAGGSVQWARRYTGDMPRGGSIAASPRVDGGWTVALAPGYFAVIDAEGTMQKAAMLEINGGFGYQVESAGLSRAGTLGVASSGTLFVVDGELENATGTSTGSSIRAIHGLSDGGFATTDGQRIARVSSGGNLRWAVQYDSGDGGGEGFRGLAQTADGGIATAGRTAALAAEPCGNEVNPADPSESDWDVWVLKVPPNGVMTPDDGSGLQRVSFEAPVWSGTQELIPVDLASEDFPLDSVEGDGVAHFRVFPGIGSHISELFDTVLYTIPATDFRPDQPIAVAYEYDKGGHISTRVTVVWDGQQSSITAFEATLLDDRPPSTFRIVLGPDAPAPRNACVEGQGCIPGAPTQAPELGAILPILGMIPNFHGALPAIGVREMRTYAGVEAACGFGVYSDDVVENPDINGEVEVCFDEETGAVLYFHTTGSCNNPDRTDESCVEVRAVEIRPPAGSDFVLSD